MRAVNATRSGVATRSSAEAQSGAEMQSGGLTLSGATTRRDVATGSDVATRRGVWQAGMLVGLRALRREPVLGLKRLALPVNYWRAAEFAYVLQHMPSFPPARVFDLGSPKDLALMLARHHGLEVVATDILPEAVALSRRYAEAQGLDGRGPGLVRSELQDGRALDYPDNCFDAAFSVSVLEHIPDGGDSAAIRELVRVVRPGGVVVVTTPFRQQYDEVFVDGPVYERQPLGSEPVFFERHYDAAALDERLVAPAGARLVDFQLWGEGAVRAEALLTRMGSLRTLLSPCEPLLSMLFLRQIREGRSDCPMAAFFTLQKA